MHNILSCYFVLSITVHGFEKHMFMVEEGNRASTAFRRDVKGTSKFESLNLPMLGTITSEPVTASKGIL